MRRASALVLIISLCLVPHAGRADTISCDAPDLGLVTSGAREQVDALLKQSAACMRARKSSRAVAILTQIIKNDPLNATAYLNRGSAQVTLSEIGLALGDYSTALKLAPDMVEAWYNRGTTFLRMRRFEAAVADFTESIRLKPNFAFAYCNRAKKKEATMHLDMSKAEMKKGDTAACMKHMNEAHKAMGM